MTFKYVDSTVMTRGVSCEVNLECGEVTVSVGAYKQNNDEWSRPQVDIKFPNDNDIPVYFEDYRKLNYAILQCYDEFNKRYNNQNNR